MNLVNCIANLACFVMQLTGLCVNLEVVKTLSFNRNCCLIVLVCVPIHDRHF